QHLLATLCAENQKDWDDFIQLALFAYKTTPHKLTGRTLFEMLYGCIARTPLEVTLQPSKEVQVNSEQYTTELTNQLSQMYDDAKDKLTSAQDRMKRWYNQHHTHRHYEQRDRVLLH